MLCSWLLFKLFEYAAIKPSKTVGIIDNSHLVGTIYQVKLLCFPLKLYIHQHQAVAETGILHQIFLTNPQDIYEASGYI